MLKAVFTKKTNDVEDRSIRPAFESRGSGVLIFKLAEISASTFG